MSREKRRILMFAILSLQPLIAGNAWAHPGHAVQIISPDSPAHYFLQPEHLLAALAVLGITLTILRWQGVLQTGWIPRRARVQGPGKN